MIGAPIGAVPICGDILSFLAQNVTIIVSGYLGFQGTCQPVRPITTFLNFVVINNDDNYIQVNVTDELTAAPFNLSGAEVTVNIYAPGTTSNPILTITGTSIVLGGGLFYWPLTHTQVENLAAGNYPWIALVDMPDGTQHTVNNGDPNLTTGIMIIVERP